MLLDPHRPARELQHFVVAQRASAAQLVGHRLQRRAAARIDHPLLLAADGLPHQRAVAGAQRFLVHVELVGHHLPLHDGLPQPVRGSDQHHAAVARLGVEGEEHAGSGLVRAHHLLHAHAERDLRVIEAHVGAIGDGAGGEERGEASLDRVQQSCFAADVEIGVLLAGEGGAGKILGGGRRAHRHVGSGTAGLPGKGGVGSQRLVRDLARHFRRSDQPPDHRAARHQRLHVVLGDGAEKLVDPPFDSRSRDEVAVGLGGDRESVGHADAQRRQFADHLAQRRHLAADQSHVGQTDFREPPDEAHGTPLGRAICAPAGNGASAVRSSTAPAVRCGSSPRRAATVERRTKSACSCGSARRAGCGACRGSRRRTRPAR